MPNTTFRMGDFEEIVASLEASSLRGHNLRTNTLFDTGTSATGTLKERGIGTTIECDGQPDDSILHSEAIGIEIELEGNPRTSDVSFPRTWMLDGDGSLRNDGLEFILRKPLRGGNLSSAITRICNYINTAGFETSERCSTHIHVDVTDLTPEQIRNFLCLSAMLEPLLFRMFGNTREVNTFCLPVNMGTENFDNIVKLFSHPEMLVNISWPKYAGIGLKRIQDLGTVEFRMFCPITQAEDYFKVINLLGRLKGEAKSMNEPRSLVDYKLTSGIQRLFTRFFPEMTFMPEFEALLEEGIQTLNDIINSASTIEKVSELVKEYDTVIEEAREQRSRVARGI